MTGRRVYIFFILSVLLLAGAASGIEIKATVDKTEVALGDPITLKVSVVGKGGNLAEPKLPDLSDFDIYSSGRSQNISVINGAFSSSLEMSYILMAKRLGDLMIGPLVARDSDGAASTDPIKIKVVKQTAGGGQGQPSQQAPTQPQRSQPAQKGGDFFIDQAVDKASPYVGEQVTLTFRFYQAVNLFDQPSLEWPKYNGLTVEDLPPNSRYYQVVGNKRYLVTEIKRALFPITDGRLVIGSPQLTIKPDDFGNAFDPFGFFDRDMRDMMKRGQPKILTTNVITLNVRPLPEAGKPADFVGSVGKYTMRVEADKDSVGVDEPITLKIVLSGSGNIRSLPQIKLPDLPDFRIYDSGSNESISNANQVISGTKTFEQAIIPKTSGRFEIPAITLSYFDPSSGTYKNLSSAPLPITATGEGLVDVGGAPKNIIGAGKLSLGYIITDFPKSSKGLDLAGSTWFWLLQVVPMLGLAAAIVYRARSKRLLSDQGYARRMGAGKRLKTIFKTAQFFKDKGDLPAFYGALYDAVTGFVADRLNLEKTGLTIEDLKESAGIPNELRGKLAEFLEKCQTARFAPGTMTPSQAERLLAEAGALVGQMEKAL